MKIDNPYDGRTAIGRAYKRGAVDAIAGIPMRESEMGRQTQLYYAEGHHHSRRDAKEAEGRD